MSGRRCPACAHLTLAGDAYCESCGQPVRFAPDDHLEIVEGPVAVVSDVGRRRRSNEDAFCVATEDQRMAVVVCDGVSTTPEADRAASIASRTAMTVLRQGIHLEPGPSIDEMTRLLNRAVEAAQDAVGALAFPVAGGETVSTAPSTTMVAAVARPGWAAVANVGDSRAYWIPDQGPVTQVTEDDCEMGGLVEPADTAGPQVLRVGRRITRWIGADSGRVPPRVTTFPVTSAGLLLLCTDGLWQYFDRPASLGLRVRDHRGAHPQVPGGHVARGLLDDALQAGGGDNVTVAVLSLMPPHQDERG